MTAPRHVSPDIEALATGDFLFREQLASIPNVAQIPPFWEIKPPQGIDFYQNSVGILAAGAGSAIALATPAIRIERDYEAVIASVGIFVDAPTALLDVTWTLLFNGAPVQGADQLRSYPRAANNLSIDFPYQIVVPGNTVIEVRAVNGSAAGPWTVGAQVIGWQWPRVIREQTFSRRT